MLESETKDTLGSLPGDKLNALDNTINNDVLNTGVFTLCVLADQDGINVVIWCLIASNRTAWSQVGKEVESTTQRKVK